MKMKKKNRLGMLCLYIALALAFTGIGFAAAHLESSAEAEGETRVIYSIKEVLEKYQNSVVQITTYAEAWNPATRQTYTDVYSYGSGSYIRQEDGVGYILTNHHVIEFGDAWEILWYDGTVTQCKLVGSDTSSDIAILSFEGEAPEGVSVLPLGSSSDLFVGEEIMTIGNPVTDSDHAYALYNTVTFGRVSGLERDINTSSAYSQSQSSLRAVKLVQVDAPINGGMSGGALLNRSGELVGIPTIKYSAAEGLGFCIAIDSVKGYIDEIIETDTVARPMLGVSVSDFDGPDEPMRNYAPRGIAVMEIMENSGAAESELEVYDIITEVDGVRVFTVDDLTDQIALHQAGDTVTLTVYRYYDQNGAWVGQPDGAEYIEVELRYLEDAE